MSEQANKKEFRFKKEFGQNFIYDKNLLSAIVKDAEVNETKEVLEIGAGSGNLTKELSERAKKVVSYEIDKTLKEQLESRFLNNPKVKIVFGDGLKIETKEIEKDFDKSYMLVANIPYYITTPLIFKFLEEGTKIESLTIMVQKEVANRICAKPLSKDWGILSVVCQRHCQCKILRNISKKMFVPSPKVDSAVVKLILQKKFDKNFSNLVRACFAMRRKTLYNNLLKGYDLTKEKLEKLFLNLKFNLNLRAENLTLEDFENLYQQFLTLKVI